MGDLGQTLDTLTKKVKTLLASKGDVGEQNTKAALIDPILQALGWQIFDLDDVQREYRYRSRGNPVDYALFIGGSPKMFVEAKPLGANLHDHKWCSQVVNYANTAGVEWCVLTDGNFWHVYKSNAPGDLDRKLFLETWLHSPEGKAPPFDPRDVLGLLSKEKLAENEIATRWKALFVDRTAELTLLGMIREKDASLVRLLVKRGELTRRDVEAWLARARVSVEASLPPVPPPPSPPALPRRTRKPPAVPGLPSDKDIQVPLLRAIVKRGGEVDIRGRGAEIDEEVAEHFRLTREQRTTPLRGKPNYTVWSNRLRWVVLRLRIAGCLERRRRGIWAVTDKGRQRAERGE